MAQMIKNLPAMQETWVWYLVKKIPWRREWLPNSIFLPGEFHGQRNLEGYSPWGRKVLDTTEWLTLLLFRYSTHEIKTIEYIRKEGQFLPVFNIFPCLFLNIPVHSLSTCYRWTMGSASLYFAGGSVSLVEIWDPSWEYHQNHQDITTWVWWWY